jgi:hypothetical protein
MPTLEQLYDIFASVFLIFCPTRCAETGLSTPYIFIKLIPCICFICHVEGQSNLIVLNLTAQEIVRLSPFPYINTVIGSFK